MVTLAGCVFISKVKTSNPPIRIARFRNGSYRRKKDGGYILAGKSADWTVHEDWEMLLDGRELKGESITFLGEFASHPSNPKEGNSYRNTADHCTYIYRNGLWMVMVKDGTDGKDGKGYEWIYTRTNIIGLTLTSRNRNSRMIIYRKAGQMIFLAWMPTIRWNGRANV